MVTQGAASARAERGDADPRSMGRTGRLRRASVPASPLMLICAWRAGDVPPAWAVERMLTYGLTPT